MTLRISPPRIALGAGFWGAPPVQMAPIPRPRRGGRYYVGEMKGGSPNGEGTLNYPNGDKYVGQWNDGQKHGLGKYTFANGQVHHDGKWENDQAKA